MLSQLIFPHFIMEKVDFSMCVNYLLSQNSLILSRNAKTFMFP